MQSKNLIIAIQDGKVMLENRPLGCPKVVIKIYERSETIDLSKMTYVSNPIYEPNGKSYREVTWG